MKTITPQEAARMQADGAILVDIREPAEVARLSIPGAVNLPLSRLDAPEPALRKGRQVVFICASGGRTSLHAARLTSRANGARSFVVAGGLAGWQRAGLPVAGPQAGMGGALSPLTLAMAGAAGAALGLALSPWFFALPAAALGYVAARRFRPRG